MIDRARVGAEVARLRQMAGVSQADLADAVGMTQSAWSRVERGHTDIRIETMARVAEYLEYEFGGFLKLCGFAVGDEPMKLGDWIERRRESERSGKSAQPFGQKLRRHDVSRPSSPDEWEKSTNFKTLAAAALRGHRSKVSAPLRT